jgi:hypothetical protein
MRTTVVALLVVVVLGGCVGPIDGTVSPMESPSTPTDVTTTSPPNTSPAPPANANGQNTVNYSELNAHQQAAFDATLDGQEVTFVPNTSYVDDSEGYWYDQISPFEDNEYVRYRGQYYRPEFTSGPLYASYLIESTRGAVGENDTVRALSELPASVRDEVRTAITEGRYSAPRGKWDSLPEPLSDTDAIRYQNRTYGMTYTVGDMWAPVMTVERMD